MICLKCGTEFPEGIFCPECGTRIEKAEERIPQTAEELSHNRTSGIELTKQETGQERLANEKIEENRGEYRLDLEETRFDKEKDESTQTEKERKTNVENEEHKLSGIEQQRLAHEAEIEIAKQKTEQERLANERLEKEAEIARLNLEKAKIDKAEKEAREKAEKEEEQRRREYEKRLEQERVEKEKAEKAERERLAEEQRIIRENKKIEDEGKVMSIASLVMGIIALCTIGCLYVPEILGIVFAFYGKKQGVMRKHAKIGLICSIVSIVLMICVLILAIAFA